MHHINLEPVNDIAERENVDPSERNRVLELAKYIYFTYSDESHQKYIRDDVLCQDLALLIEKLIQEARDFRNTHSPGDDEYFYNNVLFDVSDGISRHKICQLMLFCTTMESDSCDEYFDPFMDSIEDIIEKLVDILTFPQSEEISE